MMIECKVERYQSNGAHHEWSVDLDETSAGNLLDSLLNEWSATLWIPGKAQELAVSTSSGMVALMLTAGDDAFYDCIGDEREQGWFQFVHGGQPANHPRRKSVPLAEAKTIVVEFMSTGSVALPSARWEIQGEYEDGRGHRGRS